MVNRIAEWSRRAFVTPGAGRWRVILRHGVAMSADVGGCSTSSSHNSCHDCREENIVSIPRNPDEITDILENVEHKEHMLASRHYDCPAISMFGVGEPVGEFCETRQGDPRSSTPPRSTCRVPSKLVSMTRSVHKSCETALLNVKICMKLMRMEGIS